MKTKRFIPTDFQIDRNKREILCIASTDTVDRDNEVVLPSGLRMKDINYPGRPILWSHNRDLPSIGSILWLKQAGNQILCKYRITDKTEFGREIFDLLTEDPPSLKDHSIGFEVYEESAPTPAELKSRPDWKEARNIIRDFEIMEVSVCNVPCNPETSVVLKSCSPATKALLGSEWESKDCWEWESVAAKAKEGPAPVAPAPIVIPRPKYARKVRTANELLLKALERHTAEELIARVKGRA